MNEQHIALWQQAVAAWDQRYDAIGEQWEAGTPCDGWSVKDLVDHAVGVQQRVAGGLLGIDLGESPEWPALRDAIAGALEDPSVLDGELPESPFGPMPKAGMLGIATSDLLIHTWDLSRAIGADETLPAGPVSAAHMGLQRIPEAGLRSEGMFGPAVDVGADADEQAKLLAFAGRQV